MQPADEYSEGTSVQPSPDRKRRNGDPYATHALTDNPLLLPLMAHPEPMQRRSRSFNDDLAWIRIAQRYSIAARSTELNVYRCTRRWQGFKNGFLNLIASFVVAMSQLCNTEAVLGCFVTIVSVTGYWFYGQYLAAHMNWSIVSLAVVFPITQGIGMGFRRREQALRDLSQVLGCTRSVWEAVQTWQIQPKGPRAGNPDSVYKAGEWVRAVETYDRVQQRELQHLFHSFLAALITYFDCVRAGRARHTVGWHMQEEAHLFCTLREQRAIVDSHISQMRRLIQDVKVKGLPGGEAHRIDNYINMIGVGFERLCAIKEYRTPRAFRAFARVYILLVGAMYGPDYIMLARSDDGDESNIIFALVYSCLIQLVMAGLFNVMLGLEDAFARRGGRGQLDSIKVPELVEAARRQLLRIASEASQPWGSPATKEDWGVASAEAEAEASEAEAEASEAEAEASEAPEAPLRA